MQCNEKIKKLEFPGDASGKESACQCRRCRFDPWIGKIPGKGNDNYFSILAWEIAWTEEPGGLELTGS